MHDSVAILTLRCAQRTTLFPLCQLFTLEFIYKQSLLAFAALDQSMVVPVSSSCVSWSSSSSCSSSSSSLLPPPASSSVLLLVLSHPLSNLIPHAPPSSSSVLLLRLLLLLQCLLLLLRLRLLLLLCSSLVRISPLPVSSVSLVVHPPSASYCGPSR